jgi:hypothetical protein
MTRTKALPVAGIILLFSGSPAITWAQATEVDGGYEAFDSCALRVRHGLFRTEIVRGTEGLRVAGIGWGNPPLGELFARSPRATVSFEAFRRDHIRSSWMTALGGIEIVGGLVARARDHEDWARALTIGGIVVEVAGMIFRARADEHLSDAIWWYNRSLLEDGDRASGALPP